jgi:hypothetical protein
MFPQEKIWTVRLVHERNHCMLHVNYRTGGWQVALNKKRMAEESYFPLQEKKKKKFVLKHVCPTLSCFVDSSISNIIQCTAHSPVSLLSSLSAEHLIGMAKLTFTSD